MAVSSNSVTLSRRSRQRFLCRGWHEVLHPDLPKSVVVQLWQRQPVMEDITRRGYAGILSYGYYLDQMRPASFHYEMDPAGKDPDSLSAAAKQQIWGGEACMWAEFVNPDNIESRIWPRAAAIAERFWSAAGTTDVKDMYRRLEYLNRELEVRGLRHQSNQLEMMQCMAVDQNITPLEKLSEVLIPTGLGVRQKARKYSSLTPLNRMVDIVYPESEKARQFENLVERFLADQSDPLDILGQMRKTLMEWRDNEAVARPIIEKSPLLEEVVPISGTVFDLCSKGLQALDYLDSRQTAPEAWRKEAEDLLSRAEKPQAEMLPAITNAVRKLIEATY